jgi:hypothetical protein
MLRAALQETTTATSFPFKVELYLNNFVSPGTVLIPHYLENGQVSYPPIHFLD